MNDRRAFCQRAVAIVVAVGAAWIQVSAEDDWTLLQVTDLQPPGDYSMSFPALSGDGRIVGIYCNLDLGGLNPDGGNEVFLLDVLSHTYTAVTDVDGTFSTSLPPSLDSSATTVSHFSWPGSTGAGAVHLWQTSGASTELVPSDGMSVINPSGTWLAFTSTLDLTGDNPGGNQQVFLYDVANASFRQITNTTDWYHLPVQVNEDGTRVVFRTAADLTGANSDGSSEVFLWQDNGEGADFTQVSDLAASDTLGDISCSDDALRCVYATDADMLGENPDRNYEVFVVDFALETSAQITNTLGSRFEKYPAISGNGNRVALVAPHDITGGNPDGSPELLLFDIDTGTWTQITDITTSQGLWGTPAVDFSGQRIAVAGGGDLTGGDPDLSGEIYLAIEGVVYYDGFESGDPSAWTASVQ